MDDDIHIRERKICLAQNGEKTQAADACAALRGIKGVYDAQPISSSRLTLSYSLEHLTFELVEELLKELGFFLDKSIPAMIRRNIYQYLEDNAREKIEVIEENQTLVCDIDPELPREELDEYWNNYR